VDITVAQKDLAKLLTKAAAIVVDKPKKPIMACVILDAHDGVIIAKAADDDITMSITMRTACEVAKPGIVAVNAKDLLARIQLHTAGPVRLRDVAGKLEIHGIGTKRKHVLQTMTVSDYPSFPEPHGKTSPIRLVSRSLSRALAHVEYAQCTDEQKPMVNGTAIEFDGTWMHVVATDGHVIARISSEFVTDAPVKLLVQRQSAIQLRKIIDASRTDPEASNIDIAVDGANMFFTLASTRLSVKMMSVEFVNWLQILGMYKHASMVEVGRAKLIDMIRSADVSAKEGYVKIDFAPTLFRVWAGSDDVGASDDVEVTYNGKSFTLGLTAKHALDVLNALECDVVRLLVGESGDPGLEPLIIRPVSDKTDEQFDGLVMPRRV
jgi:DNA polymerase III sliding clamp (beta) subunit (PCNA family)